MPKISIIIPVYKSENTLRKCVESIVYGEEKDLEVILVEDCSPDGSWVLCQRLEKEYPQVKSVRNERNRGVSYTRNRGLEEASGKYVLFVDSDDWVSGSYAKTLIETQENNPGSLVVCGYTFIDHTSNTRTYYGVSEETKLLWQDFFQLVEKVLFQQLWNKVFCLEEIRKHRIRFNETINMGEDYQFVLDVIERSGCKECVIIDRPMYYYVRYGNGSLMDNWVKNENIGEAINRIRRLSDICGVNEQTEQRIEQFKQSFVYHIARAQTLSKEQKLEKIQELMADGKAAAHYRKQRLLVLREKVLTCRSGVSRIVKRIGGKLQALQNTKKIRKAQKAFTNRDVTIISQNCIGGVVSHDMNMPFRSPTINMFFPAKDFVRFVSRLEHYLNMELLLSWTEEYPVGKLDDVELHFVHYSNCQEAKAAWERRKNRVNLRNVVVLSTDRDGFDDGVFTKWKALPYPKLLFTACEKYVEDGEAIYFPQYSSYGCVPDLIPKREFYIGNKLVSIINNAGTQRVD